MHRFDPRPVIIAGTCAVLAFVAGVGPAAQAAPAATAADAAHARVVEHWSPARRAAAIPRDLVLDERGQAYLKRPDGSLAPYGRSSADDAASPAPMAKPGGGTGDSSPPAITSWNPVAGATIGAAQVFQATVVDPESGLRSVRFIVQKQNGTAQSFTPTLGANNLWSASLSGFTDGNWSWTIEAKNKAGATSTAGPFAFAVATGGGTPGDGIVTNQRWTGDGKVRTAVGRIYFEMPSNSRRTRWAGYVCSGTVVEDASSDRSIVLTAAHCVYDDQYKAFARNVLFIPNQDGTSGAGTDRDCSNDPLGCWTPAFGVVDSDWTTRTFPDNIPWDYAFYVVNNGVDSHSGAGSDGNLDALADTLPIDFTNAVADDGNPGSNSADFTHALGYSYSDDPFFMYCAEDMTTEGTDNWWLPSCGLSGGSSGGPWAQPLINGTGPIISLNSWGYTGSPGMAGPKLNGSSSAACVFGRAKVLGFPTAPADGNAGYAEGC